MGVLVETPAEQIVHRFERKKSIDVNEVYRE